MRTILVVGLVFAAFLAAIPFAYLSAQTNYFAGSTIAFNQASCSAATSGTLLPLVTDGSSVECNPWPASSLIVRARVATDSSGAYTWTFPAACQDGSVIPAFSAVAEGPSPVSGVSVNPQTVGVPTGTGVSFQITKQTATIVALLGLTIAVTASGTGIGATILDLSCAAQ